MLVGWLVGLHCFAFRRFASLRMVALLRFALRLPCFALLRFASRRNQGEAPPFDSLFMFNRSNSTSRITHHQPGVCINGCVCRAELVRPLGNPIAN